MAEAPDNNKAGDHPPLEQTEVTLGYIPLSDSAPLVIAKERGFFAEEGLEVTLSRERSWATLRDKVSLGLLDGAQMLVTMPLAARLGVCGPLLPLVTGLVLDLNGNAITLDNALFQCITDRDLHAQQDPLTAAETLKQIIDDNRRDNLPKLRFGVVFPTSTQNYELRYWLASGGIDPDNDVDILVIPPEDMVNRLAEGDIAGFCVGEPWNTHAVCEGLGTVVATKYQLWNNSPEKVFGVSEDWANQHPGTHRALIRALLKACIWLDNPENRLTAAWELASKQYIDIPLERILPSLSGQWLRYQGATPESAPDFHVFHRYSANFPWLNHAEWYIAQMYRWGQLLEPVNIAATAEQVFLPDLYREVATSLGVPCPAINRKTEGDLLEPLGLHDSQHIGPNRFLDGKRFEVGGVINYLEQQSVNRADLAALRTLNTRREGKKS